MRIASLEKIVFVLAVALLAFLYGFATRNFNWPPSEFLERAWLQAQFADLDQNQKSTPWFVEPRVYFREGIRSVRPAETSQAGLTLIATWWKDLGWSKGLKLIDRQGNVVHKWRIDGSEIFPAPSDKHVRRDPSRTRIHGIHLFPDGDVLVNISYVGTARIDACGDVVWSRAWGSHHSIDGAEDGTFWVTAGTFEIPEDDSARYRGLDPEYRPRMLRITGDGEIINEIDVLDLLYENDLQRHLSKGSAYSPSEKKRTDPVHMNDIEPLSSSMADEYPLFQAGDLLVSLHHLDLVFVVDPETGRAKWHASEPFIQQHDPDFIGEGWIGVFDNNRDGTERGTMQGGSRIVFLQPHTDSMKVPFPTSRSEPFYTDVQGKWQQLENGNLLLTESQAGRAVEVTPNGRTVWDWVAPSYNDRGVPQVTEATRYDMTREDVAAWPCAMNASLRGPVGP